MIGILRNPQHGTLHLIPRRARNARRESLRDGGGRVSGCVDTNDHNNRISWSRSFSFHSTTTSTTVGETRTTRRRGLLPAPIAAYWQGAKNVVAPANSLMTLPLFSDKVGSHCSFTTTTTTAADVDRTKAKGPYGSYHQEYVVSRDDPHAFWRKAADLVEWHESPQTILQHHDDDHGHSAQWFPDGKINLAYNCLDVQVQNGRGNQNALIYDSPVTGVQQKYTYQELLDHVSNLAHVLTTTLGVEAGDRVIIYMPMIPEAVMAMLACSRIGATHSVVFGGFAAKELASRITDCQPKVILSASAGVEPGPRIVPYKPLVDEALKLATHNVQHTIIVQRDNVQRCNVMGPRDLDYHTLLQEAAAAQQGINSTKHEAVALPSSHVHHILYTSGTTGAPKGVVRDTGGYAVGLKYAMGSFYGAHPGEVYWAASDIGWTVGHMAVYGPLLHGCTTVLYEGKPVGTPDAGAFWRVIQECMFVCGVKKISPTTIA